MLQATRTHWGPQTEGTMADVWPMIHAERASCADLFDSLPTERWTGTTLCPEWSVREMAGHIIASAEMTGPKFFGSLAKAGFSFDKMVDADARRISAADPSTFGARLRDHGMGTNHPPGPVPAMLGEVVVHGEDMRRPLGLPRAYPEATLVAVAEFYQGSSLIVGAKKRIAGLGLVATDADWSLGHGPEITGPLLSIILAMTGRPAGLTDLEGDGLATLAGRM